MMSSKLKHSLQTLILSIFPFMVDAALEERMREADEYYEAKNYGQALDIYEGLLNEPLTAWQQSAVMYNIGSVYLASGQNVKALAQFDSIPLGNDPSPLLVRDIKTNSAMAYLNEEKAVSLNSLESFSRAIFYLGEARTAIKAAQDADCKLDKAEGSPDCPPALDLLEIQGAIKMEFARVLESVNSYRTKNVSVKEGMPLLLVGINQMQKFTEFLQNIGLNDKMLNHYLEFGVHKGKEWQPLWEALKTRLGTELSGNPKLNQYLTLFSTAGNNFIQGLNYMGKGAIQKSGAAFEDSEKALSEVFHGVYGANPLQEQVQKLYVFYQMALLQDPLQETTLAALQVQEQQVNDLLPANFKGQLDSANRDLAGSFDYLKGGDNAAARFYLLKASHEVALLARSMRPAEGNLPQRILEDAIEDQRYAISLNRQMSALKKDEFANEEEKAQRQVLTTAEPFLQAVLDWQTFHFQNGPIDDRCQSQPWDEVLPLFDKGLRSAQYSLDLSGPARLTEQGSVIAAWQEALKKMQEPRKPGSGSCHGAQQARQEQKGENKKEQQPSFEQVARQLEKMDEEDKLPKTTPAIPINVERPW